MRHCSPASFVLVAASFVSPANAQELLYELYPPGAGEGAQCGRQVTVHGSRFAVSTFGTVYVGDLGSGEVLYQVDAPAGPAGYFGEAIALSEEFLLVGEYYANGGRGAVHVYHSGTGQPLSVLEGQANGKYFGAAVALLGRLALVGGLGDPGTSEKGGMVVVIDLETGLEVARLVRPNGLDGDAFGGAIDANGSTVVVGATGVSNHQGAAFVVDPSTWTIGAKLSVAGSYYLGSSVALLEDRVVVGTIPGTGGYGKAHVFDVTTGGHLLTLQPEDYSYFQYFGGPVAITGEGILVGAYGADTTDYETGAAYFFSLDTGEQLYKLGLDDGQDGDRLGWSVALSDRGIALLGAPGADGQEDDCGALVAFRMPRTWHVSPSTGHLYTLTDTAASWHEARQQAAALGGELATIHDAVENAWLAEMLPDDGLAHWIGLTDEAQEGTFVWASGEPLTFASWAPGEPDDAFGADFVTFDPSTGLWRDEPAVPGRRAIVEASATDCDGNGVPDSVEIGADPTLDWNGDGQLDTCVPPVTCDALPNSTGQPARIDAEGSPFVADDDLTLVGTDLPTDVLGYFLMSAETDEIPFFGGGAGVLCLGGDIARFNKPPQGAVLYSGDFATMEFRPHLGDLPLGIVVQPGEHWYFQLWFRDYDPLPTSNTTPGLDVLFR